MSATPSSVQVDASPAGEDRTRLRDLSATQWRSGIAAWLGWLFDGLDMHLYTIVALPFVSQLMAMSESSDAVATKASIIQASFLVGWALGGGFFGRIGDRLGRARALMLTIFTYAAFTGLSFFAQTWWHLLLCRFLAALGIGGEWAVGAALLAETWPKKWRPWIAATLQSAVNIGVLLAMVAAWGLSLVRWSDPYYTHRTVFLVGLLPALLVLWIRRAVPEPEEWRAAKQRVGRVEARIRDLFRGSVRRTTLLTIGVCAFSLSGHWAFMYWFLQHLNNLLKDAGWQPAEITRFKATGMVLLMLSSIAGNYVAGMVAKATGYRRAIALMCAVYFMAMVYTYGLPRGHGEIFWLLVPIGVCQGVFGLFTMYLPPLFPTLLRTTGAGFCYNIGRIAAAVGTVFFGIFSHLGDHRLALLYSSVLFLPAAGVAMMLGEPPDEVRGKPAPAR